MTEYLVTYRNVMKAVTGMPNVGPERQMVFNVVSMAALFAEMRMYERVVVDVVLYEDSDDKPVVHASPRPAATNTPPAPTPRDVLHAIVKFVEVLDTNTAERFSTAYPNLKPPTHGTERGRRFVKVVRSDAGGQGQRFAECFVDLTNGDVIKAAGWAGPQRDREGNLAVRYNLLDDASRDSLYAKAGKVSGYLYA
jgi:hypothetical protein